MCTPPAAKPSAERSAYVTGTLKMCTNLLNGISANNVNALTTWICRNSGTVSIRTTSGRKTTRLLSHGPTVTNTGKCATYA